MPISKAVTPLRMIFWGALLCILDFSFSSYSSRNGGPASGFQFDILNDLLGMIHRPLGDPLGPSLFRRPLGPLW